MSIVLSDSTVNSYGFRLLTEGADLTRFENNPVLLDTHELGNASSIMGRWENIRIQGDQILADPVFDLNDPRAAEMARKYEEGFLKAASVGARILATSEAEEDMLPGQTLPTVTRWELMEASLVPIPGNANAVRLFDESGNRVPLAEPQRLALALGQQSSGSKPSLNHLWQLLTKAFRAEQPGQESPDVPSMAPSIIETQLRHELTQAQRLNQTLTQENTLLRAEVTRLSGEAATDRANDEPDHDPAGTGQRASRNMTDIDHAVRLKWEQRKKFFNHKKQ